MAETFVLLLFGLTFLFLLSGFPVAWTLAGSALVTAGIGIYFDEFDAVFLQALPERLFGLMTNETLVAIPLFIYMGLLLQKARVAEDLLLSMATVFRRVPGGMAVSVCIVGAILAASTGIVGATVVTMGLISMPSMLKEKYSPELSAGVICAAGTLGQIIPPSIVLVILGDVMGTAYQQAQLNQGLFQLQTVSVGDLFMGAVFPGILLVTFYILYVIGISWWNSRKSDIEFEESHKDVSLSQLSSALFPPLLLILAVLGSIGGGIATPTEAASVGAIGAFLLILLKRRFRWQDFQSATFESAQITSMVFTILIGASVFSLVFRGFEGDEIVQEWLLSVSADVQVLFLIVMATIFFLGFFLDFFEITFVIVPIIGPILLEMGLDPIWLGVMIAINLQTSFLTPPFGFSLFYLRGVAPAEVSTMAIYRGVIPFIMIQLLVIGLLWWQPQWVTWWK